MPLVKRGGENGDRVPPVVSIGGADCDTCRAIHRVQTIAPFFASVRLALPRQSVPLARFYRLHPLVQVASLARTILPRHISFRAMDSAATTEMAASNDQPKLTEVKEGKAAVLFEEGKVFYNKVQVQNRDLSVAAIRAFRSLWVAEQQQKQQALLEKERARDAKRRKQEDGAAAAPEAPPQEPGAAPAALRVLEALSATGLRSVRYAKEIEGLDMIMANDVDPKAVEAIRRNMKHNGVPEDEGEVTEGGPARVVPNRGDASLVCYMHREMSKRFHVVDLDPYGSAAPFLDGAVQCVVDGGLLCVTCTDLAVLCGNHSEACHAKYGSISLRGKHCHEFALRIVLASIEQHANRYKRHVVPLLSVHMDFYVRLFVRVYTSAEKVKHSASKLSTVYQCPNCSSHYFQPLGKIVTKDKSVKFLPGNGPVVGRDCPECGGRYQVGGPIWNKEIHDVEFVHSVQEEVEKDSAFASAKRLSGLLTVCKGELPDIPLFYSVSALCNTLHSVSPPLKVFRSALANLGFRHSQCHSEPGGVKTDAPPAVLWDIMRKWVELHPVKDKGKDNAGKAILAKPCSTEAVRDLDTNRLFKHHSSANPVAQGAAKFIPAPSSEWGPMARAHGGMRHDASEATTGAVAESGGDAVRAAMAEKRKRNQDKNIKKKKPCLDYKQGQPDSCRFGDSCRYLHDDGDSKPSGAN